MAYVRFSLLQPRPGEEAAARRVLDDLDSHLAQADGLLLSLVMGGEGDGLGRVAIWRSKAEANREAVSERTLALRSRLQQLTLHTQEHLFELDSGHFRRGPDSLVLLDAAPSLDDGVYQAALPVD